MSQHRAQQVGSILKRAIQERLLRGLADPRVRGSITVTGVTVSSDLKTATVLVSITPESEEKLTMHGLKAASRHIRHQISDRISLAHTPQLTFKLDQSLKTQAKVLGLISQGMAEIEERESRASSEGGEVDQSRHEHESPASSSETSDEDGRRSENSK